MVFSHQVLLHGNLSEEDFIPEAFSTLKLRLGYGITGNQDGLGYGNFIRRERYADVGPDNGGNINPPGLTTVAFANPDLKMGGNFPSKYWS